MLKTYRFLFLIKMLIIRHEKLIVNSTTKKENLKTDNKSTIDKNIINNKKYRLHIII